MPVIALRGLTIFPNVLIHFDVARDISIKSLETAMTTGSPVFLVAQKDISVEVPDQRDLYVVGTISNVRQILRMPGDNVRVMVEGQARGKLLRLLRTEPYLEGEILELPEEERTGTLSLIHIYWRYPFIPLQRKAYGCFWRGLDGVCG